MQLCASRHAANKAGTQCRLYRAAISPFWLIRNRGRMLRHPAPSTSLAVLKVGKIEGMLLHPTTSAVVCQPWRHTTALSAPAQIWYRGGVWQSRIDCIWPYLASMQCTAVPSKSTTLIAKFAIRPDTSLCSALFDWHVVLEPPPTVCLPGAFYCCGPLPCKIRAALRPLDASCHSCKLAQKSAIHRLLTRMQPPAAAGPSCRCIRT